MASHLDSPAGEKPPQPWTCGLALVARALEVQVQLPEPLEGHKIMMATTLQPGFLGNCVVAFHYRSKSPSA